MSSLVKKFNSFTKLLCPKRTKEEIEKMDTNLRNRLRGFAFGYAIIWALVQIIGFVALMFVFVFSSYNEFMYTKTCCTANILMMDDYGKPLEDCGQKACRLYDFSFSGSYSLIQDRPRYPFDGPTSRVFEINSQKWCCNLAETSDTCCDYLPIRVGCGCVGWMSTFSAIVAMFMTQVVLQGFYSFCARRSAWWVVIMSGPVLLLRLLLFVIMFYILWGFMFSFLFFWVAMYYCDNPYVFKWYKFGAYYSYYFFSHIERVFRLGFTRWNGELDMDALVGAHTVYAFITDFIFGLGYVLLNRQQDPLGKYFDLTFFDL